MELKKARAIADDIVTKLKPFCERIEIVGSIRRGKPFVHDIDIVCIPANQGQFVNTLHHMGLLKVGGGKLIRVELQNSYPANLMLDVYIATPDTWATLLLIRTGSKEHNIRMCIRARSRGMTLKADGSGLFNVAPDVIPEYREARIDGDTEESIFKALNLPYLAPEQRN